MASLQLEAGAGEVTVRTADLGTDLYRVSTNPGAENRITVRQSGSRITMAGASQQTGSNLNQLDVQLDRKVRWELVLNGGSSQEYVDLSQGQIQSLDLSAGAYQMHVNLGKTAGSVPVKVTGGATDLILHLPSDTGANLHVSGTVNQVTIDGDNHGRVTGGGSFTVGSGGAEDGYLIDCKAGLNTLTVSQG
jgi:hypothetical protein